MGNPGLKLSGKPREMFIFIVREAASEMTSEAEAKALWDIAKVRAIGNPTELTSAIRAGEFPQSTIDRLLLSAMQDGNWTMAEVLITNGANTSAQTADKDAWTLLHFAVFYQHTDITRLLLKHGADPNRPNGLGQTALQMAQQRKCSKEVIGVLSGAPQKRSRWQFWKRGA